MIPTDTADAVKYRNALLWAVDYFSTSRLTEKERMTGVKELGSVLTGRPSRAADYAPNEWDDSAKFARGPIHTGGLSK